MTQDTVTRLQIQICTEAETRQLASQLAQYLKAPLWLHLEGNLGAGKTTFTRYVLRALGHKGSVKSPTYTLVEPYQLSIGNFLHFDLYRLGEPEELDYLGIRDYIESDTIAFVEWPSKGKGFLPIPDICIKIVMDKTKRNIEISGSSVKGEKIISALATDITK